MAQRREPVFRSRDLSDLDTAAALVFQVVRDELGPDVAEASVRSVEEVRRGYDPARDVFEGADLERRLAGVLLITGDPQAPGSARLVWLAVDPSARGRGIGRELLSRALERCRERRIPALRARAFAAVPAATHLLWMLGFSVVDLTPFPVAGRPTRETIVFEKRLGE